jgi:hypothetical protein
MNTYLNLSKRGMGLESRVSAMRNLTEAPRHGEKLNLIHNNVEPPQHLSISEPQHLNLSPFLHPSISQSQNLSTSPTYPLAFSWLIEADLSL